MPDNPSLSNKSEKNLLLTITMLGSFFTPFMGASVNVALPIISKEFTMDAVSMSWITTGFILSAAVFLVPFGKIADIFGRKKIFILGITIFTIASFFCAIAINGEMLIASRLLQGAGSAMVFGTSMAIVISAFQPNERGKIIGMNVSAVYLGLTIAPVLGGMLTETLGWRSLFYLIIPFGIFVVYSLTFIIKSEWAEAADETFDFIGSFFYMISISSLMYGFSHLPGTFTSILTIAGIAGLISFIIYEQKIKFPVLNISLFRKNRVFAFSNLAAFINYAATFAVAFVMSLYLQYAKGMSPKEAGAVLVAQPIVMTLTTLISGRLSDRYNPGILASIGMTIIIAGLIPLIFLNTETSLIYIIISLVILGLGFGLFSSPNTNAVMSSVEKKYLGIASATLGTMRLTGQMFSMGIATLAVHAFIGKEIISKSNIHNFLNSLQIIFITFTILCIVGVFASLARGKQKINY
ncbi:MAG TPA: MFS transporter [Bacteroidales bacterium]|nr:MAG: MFS transporter [Bacteroidetes bacterium GWF2_35_48]OFY99876.1 MAG: MFS transporter [Bacteroidetes bacterium RIFOXYC12_FULL_35_7]HBX50679.1 MFS transporter [Bacteroidales bacterium]